MALLGEEGKKYGLVLTKKTTDSSLGTVKKSTIFIDDSDEDEGNEFREMKFDMKKEALRAQMKKQTQLDVENALQEDPTVFQYDEVYEQITNERITKVEEKKKATFEDKKPKYIAKLMKTAADRKLERELQTERKVQSEREAEQEMYSDKEAFVTSAYKAKMAELKELQQKQRAEEADEANNDVTKQGDLTSFYRHMLASSTRGETTGALDSKEDVKKEIQDISKAATEVPVAPRSPQPSSSQAQRQYRSRRRHSSDEEVHSPSEKKRDGKESDLLSTDQKKDNKSQDRSSANEKIVRKLRDESPSNKRKERRSRERSPNTHRRDKSHKQDEGSMSTVAKSKERVRQSDKFDEATSHGKQREDRKVSGNSAKDKAELEESKFAAMLAKVARRNTDDSLKEAKEKYLARKAMCKTGPVVEVDSD